MQHILQRVDLTRDLHFQTKTTIDTLDYSGTDINSGSKVAITVAGEVKRTLANEIPIDLNLPDIFNDVKMVMPGILAVKAPKYTNSEDTERQISILNESLKSINLESVPLMILCDDAEFTAATTNNFVWVTFTRSNPSHDIYGINSFTEHKHWGCKGSLIIDARIKPHHAPPLIMDAKVEENISKLWQKGGSLYGVG
jgi:4-hydroxy-3-polyprenylbenzoate decarboxylase